MQDEAVEEEAMQGVEEALEVEVEEALEEALGGGGGLGGGGRGEHETTAGQGTVPGTVDIS